MDEVIIAAVFKREPVWNPNNELHKNAVVLKRLWAEIAVEVNKDAKFVKSRWKNIRAYFMKERKKLEKLRGGDGGDSATSTWKLFDSLMFLRDIPQRDSNILESEFIDEDISAIMEQEPVQMNLSSSESSTPVPIKKKKINIYSGDQFLELEKRKVDLLQRESDKEDNDDRHFFESLLPYMARIPDLRKLKLRSKIQELLISEIEELEREEKKPQRFQFV